MLLLYNIGLRLYFIIVYLASLFNKKAGLWIKGRKNNEFIRIPGCFWFHCASLGEFEQGRPVLERLKELYPANKIIITFFSSSGYEGRKNTPLADAVYYLPLDTGKNARNFIDAIQPQLAVFTKYEYWYHFYNELNRRDIPLYIISGIFRPGQVFFKWYGNLHRKMLTFVNWFFVQDVQSKQLLEKIGVDKVSVSGDTRFDRVWVNAQQPKDIPVIAEFKNAQKVFIAGSTWPPDEHLIAGLISRHPDWKFIIAPHEINEEKIKSLLGLLPEDSVMRFSRFPSSNSPVSAYQTFIIDNIGMLSSLYQYGDIAYVGGGFGAGIHNTLEAAAFGLPVIFGPNYSKFKEANDLIALQAGFTVKDEADLQAIAGSLINDEQLRSLAGEKAGNYVERNIGATETIINHIIKSINIK